MVVEAAREILTEEKHIESNHLALELVSKINENPKEAVTYLVKHSDKYNKSHIHLLLTLLENWWYKEAEKSFLALPMDRLEAKRMHKHINDISDKIHEHVEMLNKDVSKDDPERTKNENMGKGWKKKLYFKYFPEAAAVIYGTEEKITEVLSIEQ